MDTEQITKVPLGCFDYAFSNLVGIYFYEGKLQLDDLKKSFHETLKLIPILSSVIKRIEKNEDKSKSNHYFQVVKPSNVQFYEKHDIEDLHSLYLPNEDGVLSFEEAKRFYKYIECVELPTDLRKPKCDVPVLKITLLHTIKEKSVLCISCNHGLMDAHAFALFMNAWSDGEKRIIKKFTMSRDGLKSTPNFDLYKCKRKVLENLKEVYPLKEMKKEEAGFKVLPQEKCVTLKFHFSYYTLQSFKKMVKEKFKDQIFSSNDCICAYLWKLHAAYSGKDLNQVTPLAMVVEIRERFSKLDKSYFGNAMTVPSIDLTRKEVLEMDFASLVMKVRGLLNIVDDELIQTTIDCVDYVARHDMTDVWATMSRNTRLTMNDWRIFDKLRPHFGSKCSRVLINPPDQPFCVLSLFTVTAGETEKDGLFVHGDFDKEVFEKMKRIGIKLGTLESLEKIKELLN